MRGLSTEGNLCFKLDRASLIVGSKFTIFFLFYLVFEGNYPSTSPWGAYISRGDLTEGFLRYRLGGPIFAGAYTCLIVGSKFTIFFLFYLVFEGNYPSTSPWGAYISRGDLTEGFLRYRFGGPIFAGAYTWRGLFLEFYGIYVPNALKIKIHR